MQMMKKKRREERNEGRRKGMKEGKKRLFLVLTSPDRGWDPMGDPVSTKGQKDLTWSVTLAFILPLSQYNHSLALLSPFSFPHKWRATIYCVVFHEIQFLIPCFLYLFNYPPPPPPSIALWDNKQVLFSGTYYLIHVTQPDTSMPFFIATEGAVKHRWAMFSEWDLKTIWCFLWTESWRARSL